MIGFAMILVIGSIAALVAALVGITRHETLERYIKRHRTPKTDTILKMHGWEVETVKTSVHEPNDFAGLPQWEGEGTFLDELVGGRNGGL